ncbi:hypothetical protein [Olleya sp. R77988]|uniref:hypothetical protein n=1 Tax=Olleya sp. R77988 TaxID=3093875 RepID=UPI0037C9DEFA
MSRLNTILSIFTLFISLSACENEPIGGFNINAEDVITVNSELYNQLERITDDTNPTTITCIEFNYPLTMHAFDDNLQLLSTSLIPNDAQFLIYLNNLEDNYSISLSYPITTTLANGSTFSINNNEELKTNIDACIEEEEVDQIEDCIQLIRNCVWKVGYTDGANNSYLGGIFNEEDGATVFIYNNQLYFGSWTVLFIENELHINISINDNNDVGAYFNFDWKVEYLDEDSLQLINEDKTFIIHQYCDNDHALCNDFVFTECELANTPGVAEFTLNDYNFCIINILQVDNSNISLLYFETNEDAENNINPILSDQIYLNTSQIQVIYIRVENSIDQTYTIIPIIIEAEAC